MEATSVVEGSRLGKATREAVLSTRCAPLIRPTACGSMGSGCRSGRASAAGVDCRYRRNRRSKVAVASTCMLETIDYFRRVSLKGSRNDPGSYSNY
jgi:hypothetical protein